MLALTTMRDGQGRVLSRRARCAVTSNANLPFRFRPTSDTCHSPAAALHPWLPFGTDGRREVAPLKRTICAAISWIAVIGSALAAGSGQTLTAEERKIAWDTGKAIRMCGSNGRWRKRGDPDIRHLSTMLAAALRARPRRPSCLTCRRQMSPRSLTIKRTLDWQIGARLSKSRTRLWRTRCRP